MEDSGLHWFVIYTRSRFEKKVAEALHEANYNIYLPLIKTLRQWSDRKKKIEVPLFRSYVFVYTTLKKINCIQLPVGAVKVIKFEDSPAIVQDVQIQNLKILLNTCEKFDVIDEFFAPGDPVEVTTGPLQGLKGVFVNHAGKKYIRLQIDALQQSIIITVNPIFIRKIPSQPSKGGL